MTVQRTGNLNATPQYENEHGCRSYVGELPTGHVCMKPEVSQLSPAPGVFVNLPERIQKYWGDGADEKNRATLELDEATANVAKAAELVIEFIDLLDPYKEQWLALRDAIANRRAKQEAFLRAMANQPDPKQHGPPRRPAASPHRVQNLDSHPSPSRRAGALYLQRLGGYWEPVTRRVTT